MAEGSLGKRVRCFGCGQWFIAAPDMPEPGPQHPATAEEPPTLPGLTPRLVHQETTARGTTPLCPACGRRISWHVSACPHCREELEPEDGPCERSATAPWPRRRDGEPHRGPTIYRLGLTSLVVGTATLCPILGPAALIALPAGVVAWVMANRDLSLMRTGMMDSDGRSLTENGRTFAVLGVLFSLCFGTVWAAFFFPP
jgi:hypothetical protein